MILNVFTQVLIIYLLCSVPTSNWTAARTASCATGWWRDYKLHCHWSTTYHHKLVENR